MSEWGVDTTYHKNGKFELSIASSERHRVVPDPRNVLNCRGLHGQHELLGWSAIGVGSQMDSEILLLRVASNVE